MEKFYNHDFWSSYKKKYQLICFIAKMLQAADQTSVKGIIILDGL